MKQRIAAILSVALMMVSLAACGGENEVDKPESTETAEAPAAVEAAEAEEEATATGIENEPEFRIAYYTLFGDNLYEQYLDDFFACWSGRMNLAYDGMLTADGDRNVYLEGLANYAAAYDGLILDCTGEVGARITEIMEESQTPWVTGYTEIRDNEQEGAPLLHPALGFDTDKMGAEMADYLLNTAAEQWPDIPLQEIALLCVDHSAAAPLHDRTEAVWAAFTGRDASWANRMFVADVSYAAGTSEILFGDGCRHHPTLRAGCGAKWDGDICGRG